MNEPLPKVKILTNNNTVWIYSYTSLADNIPANESPCNQGLH